MYKTEVKIEAFEPRFVTITLETPARFDNEAAAQEMAFKELEEQYPELVDPIVVEIKPVD